MIKNAPALPALPALRPVAADMADAAVFSFVVDGRELFQQAFAPDAAVLAVLDTFAEEGDSVGMVPRTPRAVDAMSVATLVHEMGDAVFGATA